jgi:hypothetical protein
MREKIRVTEADKLTMPSTIVESTMPVISKPHSTGYKSGLIQFIKVPFILEKDIAV